MSLHCVNCTFPLPEPLPAQCAHCGAPVSASFSPPLPFPLAPGPVPNFPAGMTGFAPPQSTAQSLPAVPMPPTYPEAPSAPFYAPASAPPAGWASSAAPVFAPPTHTPPPSPPTPPAMPQPASRHGGLLAVLLAFALICSGIAGASLYALTQHSWPFGAGAQPARATATTPSAATSTPAAYSFHDSLQTNTNGWPDVPSSCFFGDGGYHANNGSACQAPTSPIRDGTVSVDVTLLQAVHNDAVAGIWFRTVDDQNTYVIVIGQDGQWAVKKGVAGNTTDLISLATTPALHQGLNVHNTITVRMTGSHFEFFANGTPIGQVDDDALAQGGFALVAIAGAEAVFSNFDVESAPA